MMISIYSINIEQVTQALADGANVNAVNKEGQTPLFAAKLLKKETKFDQPGSVEHAQSIHKSNRLFQFLFI